MTLYNTCSVLGGLQYHRGGGGYPEYHGDIMNTVRGVQFHEGYNLLLFEYPHSTAQPPQYS